jgi:ubiquinone/menaquinone biosynthesis C-methylase UbiE
MEGAMQFTGDIANIQRRVAQSLDLVARRIAVIDAVQPRTGEHILDVGCGGGFYVRELGLAVGASGRVCGLDLSADQIAAAQAHCGDLPNVDLKIGDALNLPYADRAFDAVLSVQVIEYIGDAGRAISELARVLKSGGRFINSATNWGSLFWHGADEALTRRVLDAWDRHAPHPNLPATMPRLLSQAGLTAVRQVPTTIVNTAFHENSFSYWAARLMTAFATSKGMVTAAEAEQWLAELDGASRNGGYFFSSVPILTTGVRTN